MRHTAFTLTVLVFASTTALAQSTTTPALKPGERIVSGQDIVRIIGNLGEALYQNDQAAWHGTDAFLADLPDDYDKSALRGYVVTPDENNYLRVAFHTGDTVIWEARVKGKRVKDVIERFDAPRPVTFGEAARVSAVQTGIPAVTETCPGRTPMNTAVLDNPYGEGFLVYYLSPMKDNREVVLGRHYRARVSADGLTLHDSRAFSKSCFILQSNSTEGKSIGLLASHLLDPLPQETHVFASLQHKLPLYVSIPANAEGRGANSKDALFSVEGSKIRPVSIGEK